MSRLIDVQNNTRRVGFVQGYTAVQYADTCTLRYAQAHVLCKQREYEVLPLVQALGSAEQRTVVCGISLMVLR